ncbi:TOMM precursor leader peptide-binding protein [Actinacidiphila yeochonensis]|uniref:TOMM precursor leader peptide-binding protein n=1 Tax=Actinacidiphila yeochonensis TaxID=89050 RepID=UPI001E338D9A|nr:TOMM precursor leader peptide-binding protein [Actinacidiphila yeochonensis]
MSPGASETSAPSAPARGTGREDAHPLGEPGPAAELAGALAAALAGLGLAPVRVAALGVRDELASGEAEVAARPAPAVVHVHGHHALVGPFTPEGGPGCACCLARRWQAVRGRSLRDALELGGGTRPAGPSPWGQPFAATAVAALLATRRVAPTPPAGPDQPDHPDHPVRPAPRPTASGDRRSTAPAPSFPYAFLVDLESLRTTRFALVPDAECPVCGQPAPDTAEGAAVRLDSTPKRSRTEFRARPADAYDVPMEAYVNPAAGMLGPSAVPDLVSASTSSTVGSFLLRSGDYLRECFWGGHTPSYRSSVRVGLLEGLERAAGMRPRGRRTRVTASYEDLVARGEAALDPRDCGLYDDAFHRAVPEVRPFDPARPIPWVWGWSLRDRRPLLVPEVTAYYHAPGGVAGRFVQESSNGRASGGSLTEAVYFGLMEVVERDAFLLAWYGRAPLVEVDGSASADPRTRAMIDRLAMYGYRARFFDTRLTLPVPVVTAVAERVDGGMGRLCFGAGAGLDPEAALAAGLCEIATDAVNLRSRTLREEARLRSMEADFRRVEVLHDHPLLYGLPEMARHADFLLAPGGPRRPAVTPAALARDTIAPCGDLREDVEQVVAAVAREGFDVIAVDQTMPEQRRLGFHTAAVIVPGLVPIDFGWSRQRAPRMPRMRTALRDAGLVAVPLAPVDLNPAPHPFP